MGTHGEVPGLVELRSAHQRGLGALRCQPWGAEGGLSLTGSAARCQLRRQHMAAEPVPVRLRRINLCFPPFRRAGGAPGTWCPPTPRADVLQPLPVSAPLKPSPNPN